MAPLLSISSPWSKFALLFTLIATSLLGQSDDVSAAAEKVTIGKFNQNPSILSTILSNEISFSFFQEVFSKLEAQQSKQPSNLL